MIKSLGHYWAETGPRLQPMGRGAWHARSAEKLAGPRPGSPAQWGKRPARPAATRVPARSPRVDREWDGAVACSPVARRRQGVAGDLEGVTGKVSGKEERAGAHRNGGSMVRRCKRRRVAPVVVDVRGGVLQHRCGGGEI
jgi:hypothetical protein